VTSSNLPRSLLNRQRVYLLLALIVFLASIYMFTYSGRIESEDTLYLFNATGSLVRYGDFLLDLSAGVRPPESFNTIQDYPLQSVNTEPLPIVLAAPFYWLANQLPNVGLVHAVWLFNIFVCAAAGGVLFLYALALGYDERTGVFGAAVFGLATIIWPYSKSFFREPLALLLILLVGLFAERWRAGGFRSISLLFGLGLTLGGALLSKQAGAFALPSLMIILAPGNHALRRVGRRYLLIGSVLLFALVFAVFVALSQLDSSLNPINQMQRFTALAFEENSYLLRGLHSQLLSIGGSVWGTSPILLLAIPGISLLVRRRQMRYVWASLLLLLIFAVVYTGNRGPDWFGGTSWPPRFLVPVVPFLFLLTLPVIDRVIHQSWSLLTVGFVLLAVYSIWVQLSGVSYWWGDFPSMLPSEANGLLEWSDGLNRVEYLRWVIIPQQWVTRPLDFAWVRTNAPLWALTFGALAIVSGFGLWWPLRTPFRPFPQAEMGSKRLIFTGLLPVAFIMLTWLGLRAIYADPMYYGDNTALHDMMPIINAETGRGDVLLMNMGHERFLLNYGKTDGARIIGLSFQRGERYAPEQPPRTISNDVDTLLSGRQGPFINSLAQSRERLWLLMDTGPFLTWNIRPVELYMTQHYYPMRVIETAPTVRLIEYSTTSAPNNNAFRGPDNVSDLQYGDSIRLVGYTLPDGTSYVAGDALPLSLYWQTDALLTSDYTVAWFLADANGAVVVEGGNWQPGGGFAATSGWLPNVPVWDNRALRLPETLAAGHYRLWVLLYDFDESGALRRLPVTGTEVIEGNIGILPTVIELR
jgi:hypothetical protein